MDSPRDQYREIAAVNQQPIHFPAKLGMERLTWLWRLFYGLVVALFLSGWTLSGKYTDLTTAMSNVKALQVQSDATQKLAESNKREIDDRKKGYDAMVEFYGSLKVYPFAEWYEHHRTMWEMKIRGESNKEAFFREHGYAAPGQPGE